MSTAVFVDWNALVWAQVEVEGRGVTSPFIAYDDAGLAEPGTLSIGQYASLDNSAGSKSFSVPGIDFSLGLNRRLELSAFGAVVLSQDDVGQFASKIDDSSAGQKVVLWNEADRRPGVAAKPMIERLASPNGAGRVHLVLPVILEKEIRFCDLAYTAGYVTRGIAFSSLKCGWAGPSCHASRGHCRVARHRAFGPAPQPRVEPDTITWFNRRQREYQSELESVSGSWPHPGPERPEQFQL